MITEPFEKSDVVRFLEHSIAYCDELVGIIKSDPQHELDGYDANGYQSAANILEHLRDSL